MDVIEEFDDDYKYLVLLTSRGTPIDLPTWKLLITKCLRQIHGIVNGESINVEYLKLIDENLIIRIDQSELDYFQGAITNYIFDISQLILIHDNSADISDTATKMIINKVVEGKQIDSLEKVYQIVDLNV